jgi:hypothetical protein
MERGTAALGKVGRLDCSTPLLSATAIFLPIVPSGRTLHNGARFARAEPARDDLASGDHSPPGAGCREPAEKLRTLANLPPAPAVLSNVSGGKERTRKPASNLFPAGL